jgi:simple sugar transport system permease protein
MRDAVVSSAITLALLAGVVAIVLLPITAGLAQPGAAIAEFLFGPFSDLRHMGNIVETATPLMFTGLAVSLMFRAGMFNLGAEGAFFLGGVAASFAVLRLPLPGWSLAAAGIAFGALCGSLVCLVPGYLRVRFGASELVSSLMLNYAALYLGLYVVNYVIRDPQAGAMESFRFPLDARLPRLLAGTHINFGLPLALLACGLGGVWLFLTRWGFQARVVGANAGFARHMGMNITAVAVAVQALGGIAAAAGGACQVLGMFLRFTWQDLPGQGWNGLVVAILAANNPFLVPPAALALAWLQTGGDLLARDFNVPAEAVGLVQALVILFATARAITRNPSLLRRLRGGPPSTRTPQERT